MKGATLNTLNLKTIRKSKRLTQQEVADACGIKRSRYQAYESGRREPKAGMLQKFSSALDCTVDEILQDPKEAEDGRSDEDQGQDLVSEDHEDSNQAAA